MKKLILLFVIGIISSWQLMFAQKIISGKVTDGKNNAAVVGASVFVKGTDVGTLTDVNGVFKIKLPENARTLVVSYLGYESMEYEIGNSSYMEILLQEKSEAIEEVVVTALGIKRDKKALGYSMQEIKGDDITQTRDANVVNSLNGRIAGLQVKQAATGPSGSTRVVIRGNNSIGGNNQPLIVVDGVPINGFTGGTNDYWGNRSLDKGSGISDISPDDIETISILKGPAASALYGSRAGNGVVMITTKKGSAGKGLGISFNSNTTFDSPMETPEFQDVYGQGINGAFDKAASGSWGAKMDGAQVDALMGKKAYSPAGKSFYTDFLRTGVTSTNSLELSKGNENSTVRLGISRLDNKGIIPNSNFDRTSFNLRTTGKWNKFSADAKMDYIKQNTNNRIKLASDPDNIFLNYLIMPRSVSMADYQAYENFNYAFDKHGSPASYISEYGGMSRNPYWSAYQNTNEDKKDRMVGFLALQYDFTSWLNLRARYGLDNLTGLFSDRLATGTPYWFTQGLTGDFRVIHEKTTEQNADLMLTAKGNLTSSINSVFTLGGNLFNAKSNYILSQGQGLVIPDFYAINNGVNRETAFSGSEKEIRSIYGALSLGYDNWAYLDVTGRNDISSTLPSANRSYFYPSVGLGLIVSQILENKGIKTGPLSFAKVRASWAKVGNDTDPYKLQNYYNIKYLDGVLTASTDNYKVNPDLKPENIVSSEVGFDLRFLKNRIGVDFTLYKKNAYNQIIYISVPPATGYLYEITNAGNVENKGFELAFTSTPYKKKSFTWDMALNFSKNKNSIIELTETTTRQVLSDGSVSFLKVVADVGGLYGDILGYTYQRNAAGQILVDDSGIPLKSEEMTKLGNYQPKWMAGFVNSFNFKGFDLGFVIDMRYGGDVFMGSIRTGAANGTLAITQENREDGFIVANSVVKSTDATNTIKVKVQDYWSGISSITEAWMYDATNVCFRELSLGYNLPKSVAKAIKTNNIKLSLVARNLFMLYTKTKGFNPEATYSTGNAQGLEYGSMPQIRNVGFNLNINF